MRGRQTKKLNSNTTGTESPLNKLSAAFTPNWDSPNAAARRIIPKSEQPVRVDAVKSGILGKKGAAL